MTVYYDLEDRKALVKALEVVTEAEAVYHEPPTDTYEVDFFTVTREGTLVFSDMADSELVEEVLEELDRRGFALKHSEYDVPALTELSIQMPMMEEHAIANLKALVEAKGNLIRQAIGADSLPLEVKDGNLNFPWFSADSTPETVHAYMTFISKLCEMAKSAKRVTAKEKETDNPKYEFRCFLVRLGFVGEEYKADRKLLLKNLPGSSAFKSGSKKGGEQ